MNPIRSLCVVAALTSATSTSRADSAVVPQEPAVAPPQVAAELAHLRPGVEVFGEYRGAAVDADDADVYHEARLSRARLWLGGEFAEAEAFLMVEAVPSASEGALIGVAGDSQVARFREAWAGYTAFDALEGRIGMVPTLALHMFQREMGVRALVASAPRQLMLLDPADVGATLRWALPSGHGSVGVGIYNGEGYASRELNRGKNIEVAAESYPFAQLWPALGPLKFFVGGTYGSRGAGSHRTHRLTGGSVWSTPRLAIGGQLLRAWGADGNGAQEGWTTEAFVRAEPLDGLLLAARALYYRRDVEVSGDELTELLFAAGARVAAPLVLWLALTRSVGGDAYEATVPRADRWLMQLVGRAHFDADVAFTP